MSLIRRFLLGDVQPSVPPGIRLYAIGDIHGRDDLLKDILEKVRNDRRSHEKLRSMIIFLGDYIDRGSASAQVIERLIQLAKSPNFKTHFLMGNHEEVLLRIMNGEVTWFPNWIKFGGRECLTSYGADADELLALESVQVPHRLRQLIPRAHRKFLAAMSDTVRVGDYLFVHAGLRPGVSLAAQSQNDLRWIRNQFLEDEVTDHGFTVVHGHSIRENVEWKPNRIGLDTGAYMTGKLSCLVLCGREQYLLQTGD